MENYTNYDYVIKNTTKEEMFKEADKIMSMESETELL